MASRSTAALQLGPTQIVRQAMLAGQIDLYPEYTGNGAIFFARENDPAWHDAAQAYALVKQLDRETNNIVWLAAAPADNSWAIAMRRDVATAHHLTTLADFARYASGGGIVKLAASAEFVDSPGALPAFEKAYGFKLSRGQLLALIGGNTAATLRAAAEGISGVNAAMAYATDGALAVLQLQLLADDKHAQTVYAAGAGDPRRGAGAASRDRRHPRSGLPLADPRAAAATQRQDRRRWRRACSGRGRIFARQRLPQMMPRHRVLFVLTLAAIACCALGGFVGKAPNRLVSGQPIMLWQADASMSFGLAVLAGALLLLSVRGAGASPL